MNAPLQSHVTSLDAPIEGWDAFHSLDNMPPTAAIILDNIIPEAGSCRTREGHFIFANLEVSGQVQTVASLSNEDESILVAAASGGIWIIDNTSIEAVAQDVDNIAVPGTYQSDKWQTENFRTLGESGRMILCNGVDNAQVLYDADPTPTDNWTIRDLVDTDAVGTDFIGCIGFKGRMYYWKDNDNAFYYAEAGAYEGNLTRFPLGSWTQQGGKLIQIGTWTQQDSGDGKDDFIYFLFSTGELLLYQGDDPDSEGYWEMVGRYFTAEPLSIRGHTGYGADAIIMSKDGYINLSTIVQQGRTSDVPAFSRLIHRAIKQRTAQYSGFYGWDVELFQKEGLMLFNVPLAEDTFEQHVLNTVTMRWCRFNSINVNCLEVHDERLFGGGEEGKVYAILERTSDNGLPIYFDCLYAFQYLGESGYNKHLLAAQIVSTHSKPELIQLTGYADFEVPTLGPVDIPTGLDQAIWSVYPDGYPPWNPPLPGPPYPVQSPIGSLWDEDYWAVEGTQFTTKGWQNVSAYGYSVSLLVRFAKTEEGVEWRSTGLRYFVAGAQ